MSADKESVEVTQEQVLANYKFLMALQELEKQNRLTELFDNLSIGQDKLELGAEEAIKRFQNNFDFNNVKKNLEIIETSSPDILKLITKEIDETDISGPLKDNGLEGAQFDDSAMRVMKTVHAFEERFPSQEHPSLSKRLGIVAKSLMDAKNTTNGKIVFNSVMLGVALGTGGLGVLAGAKLGMALGEKLMTIPKVRELAEGVTAKAVTYMKDTLHIPTDQIKAGFDKIQEKANSNRAFKFIALGAVALLAGGGITHLLNPDQSVLETVKDGLSSAGSKISDVAEHAFSDPVGTGQQLVAGVKDAFSFDHADAANTGFTDAPAINDTTAPLNDTVTVAEPDPSIVEKPALDPDASVTPEAHQVNGGVAADASVTPETPQVSEGVAADTPNTDSSVSSSNTNGAVPEDVKQDAIASVESPSVDVAPALSAATEYEVKSGDSLWNITKHMLGDTATNHEIAEKLQDLIKANPQIGNPDLIFPKDVIHIPEGFVPQGPVPVGVDIAAMTIPSMPDLSFGAAEAGYVDHTASFVEAVSSEAADLPVGFDHSEIQPNVDAIKSFGVDKAVNTVSKKSPFDTLSPTM
ncbi:LysM peptidoglycan-binding domain-containing protein [Pseudomonas luteola]